MEMEEIMSLLRAMKDQLNRIEERQIAVRQEIKEGSAPVQGSFASSDK